MNVEYQQILGEKSSQCKLKMLVTADFFTERFDVCN